MRGKSGGDEGQVKIMSPRKIKKNAQPEDTYEFPIWSGALATAEVGKCPSRPASHAELVVFAQESQKRSQGTLLQDVISANRAITSDIPQSPNDLFTNVESRGREQLDELWDSVGVNNDLGAVSGPEGDVG